MPPARAVNTNRGYSPTQERTPLLKKQKEELVRNMTESFGDAELMVVTRHSGLTVAEMTDLRRRMRAAGANFRVTKNRLAKRALEKTSFADIQSLFSGPTAVAFSTDPVAAAKVAVDYANENNKLSVLGGMLGAEALDEAGVEALAKLPSLDDLRGRIVGLLQAPGSKIARLLTEPSAQLARVFSAFGDAGEPPAAG